MALTTYSHKERQNCIYDGCSEGKGPESKPVELGRQESGNWERFHRSGQRRNLRIIPFDITGKDNSLIL